MPEYKLFAQRVGLMGITNITIISPLRSILENFEKLSKIPEYTPKHIKKGIVRAVNQNPP
jgi:hypothetical protein